MQRKRTLGFVDSFMKVNYGVGRTGVPVESDGSGLFLRPNQAIPLPGVMAELKNTFSWSFSAARDFETCRRRRYWSKYAMWGGWNRSAPDISQRAYRLNKMDSGPGLMGQAVEEAVMWVFRQKLAGLEVTVDQAYETVAKPFLNRCWKESKDGQWKQQPKKYCCLHEHYYPDFVRNPEWPKDTVEKTKLCIENFIKMVLPRFAEVAPADVLEIATVEKGDPESFEFEGVKIYAIPDFVYRVGDQLHIHDWKAGRAHDHHLDQVSLYGLWANVKHGYAPEKVNVFVEYLQLGKVTAKQLTPEDLEAVKASIEESVADMTEYLEGADRKRNVPVGIEEWDLAPDRSPCQRCSFFELCEPEFKET